MTNMHFVVIAHKKKNFTNFGQPKRLITCAIMAMMISLAFLMMNHNMRVTPAESPLALGVTFQDYIILLHFHTSPLCISISHMQHTNIIMSRAAMTTAYYILYHVMGCGQTDLSYAFARY